LEDGDEVDFSPVSFFLHFSQTGAAEMGEIDLLAAAAHCALPRDKWK
jgi:hypothetical protein